MARRTVDDQPDLTIPEDHIVRARLMEINDKDIEWTKNGQTQHATLAEWWWEVVDGDYKGRRVKGSCDARITNHPNNKFRAWAEALLGKELDAGDAFDDDVLIGLVADITVSHRADKRPGVDRIYEEVDEVIPPGGTTPGGDSDVPF